MDVRELVGNMDIYLLDQVLRGEVGDGAVILDCGCGRGRNLQYFLTRGHEVFGVDSDASAVARTRQLAARLGGAADDEHFRVEAVEALSFADASFDLVICNAVLHFARDAAHFDAMVDQIARVTRPGGLGFCRLATTITVEEGVVPLALPHAPGWHRLPDGSDRFLVDLERLLATTERLGVEGVGAVKTVNVQHRRAMTTWVWRKPDDHGM